MIAITTTHKCTHTCSKLVVFSVQVNLTNEKLNYVSSYAKSVYIINNNNGDSTI